MRRICLVGLAVVLLSSLGAPEVQAQFAKKWLSAGALHNWYSAVGAEVESGGFVGSQQDGLRWPGVYRYTDMQAAKALWIGARNVQGTDGTVYPYRVVHAGPRVQGTGEFFPTEFKLVARYPAPEVFVDGEVSEGLAPMAVDEVDASIAADRMIVNEVNTLLGLTMERRVLQFSQEYHDDYHLIEYTFTNTGNTDDDAEIELNQTLEDVYIFLQWRLSVARETRYIIGNGTGWGMNAMIDTWGDGVDDAMPDGGPVVRAQYAWHGHFPNKRVDYDNVGGPILPSALPDPGGQVAPTDTLGRLGASQFVGIATVHADASAEDTSDDPSQPSTTTWIGSDDPVQSNNDAFNPTKMQTEYESVIATGHKTPSHAYAVEPSGLEGWLEPTADPALGTPGGFSAGNGYGPYTLAPGESITIVLAEGAGGLSREENVRIGKLYKQGLITDLEKNEFVFQGRDSLLQTFRRAIANYESGYAIPRGPQPPSLFEVQSAGDRIQLTWDYPAGEPLPDRFEIYRAQGRFDSTYTLIHTADAGATSFDDTTPTRGRDYYYYIVAVNDNNTDATGDTPTGVPLRSSRYYTQTYAPARLLRPAGESLDAVRVVPNPYHVGMATDLRYAAPGQADRIGFLEIPGRARIQIFTEIGELIETIEHTNGSGDEYWDLRTSAGQFVASGIYLAVVTDTETGDQVIKKFVIIR